jgi:ATP-dependent DNA helicase RecG
MMPNRIIDVLRTKYLVAPIHYEGMQRIEPLEIPEAGLREMICNAIIHKDYTGTFIQMKVFDEYITLWNGGMLPPNYSVEKLMQPHESHPRNRLMANVFYLAGFIEAWGRGYEKIRDAFNAENLEMPVFEEVRGGFMATIKREKFMAIQKGHNVTSNVTSNVTIPVSSLSVVQLSERQREICELIKKNPFISGEQMSVVLSVVPRTIWRDLSDMQKKGVLIREGNTSAGHWVLLIDKAE